MRFGIHMPQGGGFAANVKRAAEIGCRTVQIFPGNPTGWRMGKLDEAEIEKRVRLLAEHDIAPLVVHCAYLINLATNNEGFLEKSKKLLNETMQRAAYYRSPYVILHTGNHGGQGVERGLDQIIDAIEESLPGWPEEVMLLLENTAGSGTALGSRFEELGAILERLPQGRLGICFDTAHAWAAGYDLADDAAVEETLASLDRTVGLANLRVVHINDTRVKRGAKVDRHAHIGEGAIGLEGFSAFLHYGWPKDFPVILETPETGTDRDRENLAKLNEMYLPSV